MVAAADHDARRRRLQKHEDAVSQFEMVEGRCHPERLRLMERERRLILADAQHAGRDVLWDETIVVERGAILKRSVKNVHGGYQTATLVGRTSSDLHVRDASGETVGWQLEPRDGLISERRHQWITASPFYEITFNSAGCTMLIVVQEPR